MENTIQQQYNKFLELPNISYNIISYLIDNNEMIFKLLKYADADAWNKPNLTKDEKVGLIYRGGPDMTNSRIFFDGNIDDSWLVEGCQLRISPIQAIPSNYIWGIITVCFEVYSHAKVNTLSNYKIRTEVIIQELINTLNGADISGLGRLVFDSKVSSMCRVSVIGSLPYKGKVLIMISHAMG